MSYIFITSGLAKVFSWGANVQYMSTRHLPAIPVLLALAALVELGGAICLITGYQSRLAALVMFGYLIVLTLTFHNYWAFSGTLAGMQETHFRKNLAIMGARFGIFGARTLVVRLKIKVLASSEVRHGSRELADFWPFTTWIELYAIAGRWGAWVRGLSSSQTAQFELRLRNRILPLTFVFGELDPETLSSVGDLS
jgi:putative oxidoreductase